MVFALAERNKIPLDYASVDALRDAYSFSSLQDFLDVYYAGMAVLRTESDFHDLANAYFERALEDNVRHAEVFFDPQAHTDRGVPLADVVGGIVAAVKEAALSGLTVYLIPCFLRHLSGQAAMDTLAELEPFAEHFRGVGLDSSELGHPPGKFAAVFVHWACDSSHMRVKKAHRSMSGKHWTSCRWIASITAIVPWKTQHL